MGEPALRALLVAAVVIAGLLVVIGSRVGERLRVRRAPLRLNDIEGRILFFSASHCSRCDSVRSVLDRLRLQYREVAHEEAPGVQERVGVSSVPLVVVRDETGAEVARFAGRISARRLRRAVAEAV